MLRKEMAEASAWMRAELRRRRATKNIEQAAIFMGSKEATPK